MVGTVGKREARRGHPCLARYTRGCVFSIAFGVVVLTTLLHLARGIIDVHARTAKALLVTPGA